MDIFKNVQNRKSPRLFKIELLLKILTVFFKFNMLLIMVTIMFGDFVTIFYILKIKGEKNKRIVKN
jgi:hypothetical protein